MFRTRLNVVAWRFLFLFFVLFSFTLVTADSSRSSSIPLLAVTEGVDGSVSVGSGLVAELYLRVVSGNGGVFLNTYPLTKVSTQLSLRVAVEQACQEVMADCSRSDFFFTIRAPPGIVGGPSAGAAASVLTAEVIGKLSKKESFVVLTGTMNTGGVIGPVGGYEEKIRAASSQGFATVLVPMGALTEELLERLKNESVNVVEVGTLRDVLVRVYSYAPVEESGTILLPSSYTSSMRLVAEDLCETVNDSIVAGNASRLLAEGKAYSAASLCFRSNIEHGTRALENASEQERSMIRQQLLDEVKSFEENLSQESPLKSYAGIQSFLSVQERVSEAKRDIGENSSSPESLAYVRERLRSARSWASVHDNGTGMFSIDADAVKDACADSIQSAEQVVSYVDSFAPGVLQRTGETLETAGSDQRNGDYVLCVFRSLKAKAEANALLAQVGVESDETLDSIVDEKLGFVKRSLSRAVARGMFPTIGYSYYEYALTLQEVDAGLSLLFVEYALEFSDLDRALQSPSRVASQEVITDNISVSSWWWFVGGVIVGLVVAFLLRLPLRQQSQQSATVSRRKR